MNRNYYNEIWERTASERRHEGRCQSRGNSSSSAASSSSTLTRRALPPPPSNYKLVSTSVSNNKSHSNKFISPIFNQDFIVRINILINLYTLQIGLNHRWRSISILTSIKQLNQSKKVKSINLLDVKFMH